MPTVIDRDQLSAVTGGIFSGAGLAAAASQLRQPSVPAPQPTPQPTGPEPYPRLDLPTFPPSGGPSQGSSPKNDWLPVAPAPYPGTAG
jgi:hypothetical protein